MDKIMTGFITDNQDPDQKGRVKASVYLSQVPFETGWLPVLSFSAGEEKGFFSLPDVGDLVVISFTDNSYRMGYVLGSLWNQNMTPPVSEENADADLNSDGNNALLMFRSNSGQRIIMDDTAGAEKVQVLNKDGTTRIEMNIGETLINLMSETDVILSSSTITGLTAEEIQAELEGDLNGECENFGIDASGDSTLKGGGSMTLEGKGVGLN